jgi:hypothetical protein
MVIVKQVYFIENDIRILNISLGINYYADIFKLEKNCEPHYSGIGTLRLPTPDTPYMLA